MVGGNGVAVGGIGVAVGGIEVGVVVGCRGVAVGGAYVEVGSIRVGVAVGESFTCINFGVAVGNAVLDGVSVDDGVGEAVTTSLITGVSSGSLPTMLLIMPRIAESTRIPIHDVTIMPIVTPI